MSTQRRTMVFCTLLTLVVWQLMATVPLYAQIIIDPPPGGPPPMPAPIDQVQVALQRVAITVDGPLAQVHLTQILRNDSVRAIEGTYLFPLPENAAIGDFQMTVDGQVIEGEILRKEDARRTYEEIVRQRRDPALLEYIGRDLFQVSVFPIPAGETRTLDLTYSQLLSAQDGLLRLRYPLDTRQFTSAPIESLEINVSLINQRGLRTIYSPNFAIETNRFSDTSAEISYHTTNYTPQGDFLLYFGTDESMIGVNVLSYQPAGEDGYFVLLAAPSVATTAETVVARDIVMVVDVSGSMSGDKLVQTQAALDYVVGQLNPDDRFNLIAFSTGVRLWQPDLVSVTTAAQEDAQRWIDRLTASGSTDINRALLEALAQLGTSASTTGATAVGMDENRPGYLLFLTDGLPTQGERDGERIIDNVFTNRPVDKSLRLFTFGVGYDVNTTLLDTLSGELNGRSSYVQPNERIDEEVGHFYQGISTPVLSDVTLQLTSLVSSQSGSTMTNTLVIDDLYPYPLPDLFAGEQLIIAGRYRLPGVAATADRKPVEITLQGNVNGKSVIYRYPEQHLVRAGGEAHVARLWASRKIGALLQQIRRFGPDQELIDAVVELSLQYGIVTPYTAAFVPEPFAQSAMEGGVMGHDDEASTTELRGTVAGPTIDSYAGAAAEAATSQKLQEAVGADAVALSETIGEMRTGFVAQSDPEARFVAGRTFVPVAVVENAGEPLLTRWIDTRYNKSMQLQTVLFGSDCYFALLSWADSTHAEGVKANLAAWLAVAPELILALDDEHALLITTAIDVNQAPTCPTLTGVFE